MVALYKVCGLPGHDPRAELKTLVDIGAVRSSMVRQLFKPIIFIEVHS